MRAFFRAVMVGTLAGAWMPLIFTVIITLPTLFDQYGDNADLREMLLTALAPLVITLPIVLVSSIVIGLPTSWLLKRLDAEQLHTYVFVGVVAGSIIPLLILWLLEADSGWWLASLGAFSGGVTAASWFNSTGSVHAQAT